jgi:uncharacterized protein (TIGR03437 family)
LPYRGADNGIYARTLRFSWSTATAPEHHFRVQLDHLSVKALAGKWQVWSDVSGQWTYLPGIAPGLLQTSQGQAISTAAAEWDVYLAAGDTLRILVQGYRANCIDNLFGTLFSSNAYAGGITLLQTCGPVNNDDLGGALLELPALPSSQGSYTVAASPGSSSPGVSALDVVVTVEYVNPAKTPPECQGRSALSPVVASGGVAGAGLSQPLVTQVSPDGLMSIFGQNFAPAGTSRGLTSADVANGQLPENLGCTCVEVNHHLAPLLFVSPTQVNFQAPDLPTGGNVTAQVVANCAAASQSVSNGQSVAVGPASPEFFYFNHAASGASPIAATNAVTGSLIGPTGLAPGATFAPAKPGDLVSLYATGLGVNEPVLEPGRIASAASQMGAPVSVMLNGVKLASSDVLYAGVAPGYAGLYQINIRVPSNAPDGNLTVAMSVDGVTSPAGFSAVQR